MPVRRHASSRRLLLDTAYVPSAPPLETQHPPQAKAGAP
eukprot:CAMPEP_0197121640 /NCGR_PEP_ID=MMETSP1390-20130617/3648_1 /TAXON_ID=38833 /ORGANISM="Micromonas sp., Strain CCMP2099" /LENGTH=38 /DNA_ID= /DNA_START= /DNA_END= /DNA_ORIENTATION=